MHVGLILNSFQDLNTEKNKHDFDKWQQLWIWSQAEQTVVMNLSSNITVVIWLILMESLSLAATLLRSNLFVLPKSLHECTLMTSPFCDVQSTLSPTMMFPFLAVKLPRFNLFSLPKSLHECTLMTSHYVIKLHWIWVSYCKLLAICCESHEGWTDLEHNSIIVVNGQEPCFYPDWQSFTEYESATASCYLSAVNPMRAERTLSTILLLLSMVKNRASTLTDKASLNTSQLLQAVIHLMWIPRGLNGTLSYACDECSFIIIVVIWPALQLSLYIAV